MMINLQWLKFFQCPQSEVDFLTLTIYILITDIKFDAPSLVGTSIAQVSSMPYLIDRGGRPFDLNLDRL